jgi:hypothetical protein
MAGDGGRGGELVGAGVFLMFLLSRFCLLVLAFLLCWTLSTLYLACLSRY